MNNPYSIKWLEKKVVLQFENNLLVGKGFSKSDLPNEVKRFPLPKIDISYAKTFYELLEDFELTKNQIVISFPSGKKPNLSSLEELAAYFSCLEEPLTSERYTHILRADGDELENGEPRHDPKTAFRCPYCKKFLYGKDKKGYSVPTEGYFTCEHVSFIVVDAQIEYAVSPDFEAWFANKMELEGDYWDFLGESPFADQAVIGTQSDIQGEIWGFKK
jgi:hypothetical protein